MWLTRRNVDASKKTLCGNGDLVFAFELFIGEDMKSRASLSVLWLGLLTVDAKGYRHGNVLHWS